MKMSKEQVITRELPCVGSLHVREAVDGVESRTITGRAIVFNQPSVVMGVSDSGVVREVVLPEAITREVLDGSDIKMTLFHDRQLILARSNKGSGTLRYDVDGDGVTFEFEAPHTADGDKALELVRRGDIDGCSFAFTTYYFDPEWVRESVDDEGNVTMEVARVLGVHDFTLTPDPAYRQTTVETREQDADVEPPVDERWRAQVDEMRKIADKPLKV